MGYRIAFGVALVLVGSVLFLERAEPELDLAGFFQQYWPAVLVLAGLASLVNLRRPTKAARAATLLVVAGSVLTLVTADLLPDRLRPYSWPIALVVIGTTVLVRHHGDERPERAVDRFFFIGHSRRVMRTRPEPSLLVLFALAGGCELHFDNSVGGGPTRLDITAGFSGIDIVVPEDWIVYVDTPTLGRKPDNQAGAADSPDEANLHIHALSVLSGVMIRRA